MNRQKRGINTLIEAICFREGGKSCKQVQNIRNFKNLLNGQQKKRKKIDQPTKKIKKFELEAPKVSKQLNVKRVEVKPKIINLKLNIPQSVEGVKVPQIKISPQKAKKNLSENLFRIKSISNVVRNHKKGEVPLWVDENIKTSEKYPPPYQQLIGGSKKDPPSDHYGVSAK